MAKKLHYFNLNGLGESIRYILHHAGEKFEDIRYEVPEWPVQSVKESLPYGQLPLYEEGNKTLNQSLAIARYLASKAGLLPADAWEQAVLDAAVLNIYDFWGKASNYFKEPEDSKKPGIKKEVLEEVVPFFFSRFEKELKANNGFFGKKLSWAEFILVGIVETFNLVYKDNVEKNYPTVAALVKTVQNLPKVKEYIAKRKPYTF